MPKRSISLCMIVKNEEANLAHAVQSAKGLVDEVIIVDTGSTDRTREIGRELGARVSSFEWIDDFSAARNYSLEQATKDWVLVLDADEYLEAGDHQRIAAAVDTSDNDAFYLHWKQSGQTRVIFGRHKMSLFRRKPHIRFSSVVHEEVFPAVADAAWELLDATIHHRPFHGNAQAKADFYLRLNQKRFEMDGGDERSNFFLGRCYLDDGQRIMAQHHWILAMRGRVRPFFAFRAAAALARENLEHNFREARLFFKQCQQFAGELQKSRFKDFYPDIPGYVQDFAKLFEAADASRSALAAFKAKYS